jgi:hypothetical protein
MVTSASNHFENRKTIRKTWANAELFPGLHQSSNISFCLISFK